MEINENTNTDFKKTPIYRHSARFAVTNNEVDLYRGSYRANMECCKAIENAVYENYHNNCLDTKTVSSQLGQTFGLERVSYILANTIRAKNDDGRISSVNKSWAASFPAIDDKSEGGSGINFSFIVDRVHPGLLDMVVNRIRKDLEREKVSKERKPSVLEKIRRPVAGESSIMNQAKKAGREETI